MCVLIQIQNNRNCMVKTMISQNNNVGSLMLQQVLKMLIRQLETVIVN